MSKLPKSEVLSKDFSKPFGAFVKAENFIGYNNQIMGEVLTLIDSSVPESPQQKALKSLIKQSFWRSYDHVWRWMNEVSRIEEKSTEGMGQTKPPFPLPNMEAIS